MKAAPLVSLGRAGVRFGDVQALHEVSLAVHRGERLMLVGANGSGKTTLLRALHGLVPCTGQRHLHGGDGGRAPVLAMVFQRPFLLSLSVRNNVRLGLWLQGVPREEHARRCEQALRRVGLESTAARAARDLSGGQQQRLATRVAYLEAGRVVVDLPVERFFKDSLPAPAEQFLKGELPWR